MPTVFGYHDVKDKDHWLASPKREEFFGPLGVTNIRTFVDPENSTRVGVLMDVADMDAVMAAMETDEAAEAMAFDGVLPETLVLLVERSSLAALCGHDRSGCGSRDRLSHARIAPRATSARLGVP